MGVEVGSVMYGAWDAGTWVWMMVVMLLLVGVVVIGILAVLRPDRDARSSNPEHRAGAQDVLDERFARGEIDREEYTERRRVLTEQNDQARA